MLTFLHGKSWQMIMRIFAGKNDGKLRITSVGVCLLLAAAVSAAPDDRGARIARQEMQSERRVALVIGNGAYTFAPLRNPVNDAKSMTETLRARGFQVIQKIDCNRQEIRRAIREFGNRIKAGGVGLFYYAGHGFRVEGENYLVPIGVDVQTQDEIEDECIKASSVLRKMESAGNRINIVILDACRNNPFARSFRSSSRGLARMDAPAGSMVAYATAPGSVASDGEGKNGLYTSALLKYIGIPNLKIEEVFKNVRREVMQKTSEIQVPWESSSLTGDFYFVLPQEAPPQEAPPQEAPPSPPMMKFGHLQIYVNAPKSKVFVNNIYRGEANPNAPLSLQLSVGSVTVRVEAQGYESVTERFTLKSKQWKQALLELPVIPPPVSPPQLPPVPPQEGAESEMVHIPAGEFQIGSDSGDGDETPVHTVYLDGFWIDKYEVTVAQFRKFKPDYQASRHSSCDLCPATLVIWHEAKAYCESLGKRLPGEAEWEKACHGPEGHTYSWGNDTDRGKGRFGLDEDGGAVRVGSYAPNGYGLYDMSGNVWEWVEDWYDDGYYRGSPRQNPKGPRSGENRVIRGGSWYFNPSVVRCANRGWSTPDNRRVLYGFRCAK